MSLALPSSPTAQWLDARLRSGGSATPSCVCAARSPRRRPLAVRAARSGDSGVDTGGEENAGDGAGGKREKKKHAYFALNDELRRGHTLSSLYLKDKQQVSAIPVIDHVARRRERDLREVAQAAALLGVSEAQVHANLAQLQTLLPGFVINLFKLKASEWARIIAAVPTAAVSLLAFKELYPGVDAGKVVALRPRMLLQEPEQMRADAAQVRAMLGALDAAAFDAVVEAAPVLVDPVALRAALGALMAMHPGQCPVAMLAQDPARCMQMDETETEPDPTYGEVTTAG